VRKALTAYYGTPYMGVAAGSLGIGFGRTSGKSFSGKAVRVERDSKNRPILTTSRPAAPVLRRVG
jgi:hypothetical protein